MKLYRAVLVFTAMAGIAASTWAAIPVPSSVLTFDTQPAAADWSTKSIAGDAGDFSSTNLIIQTFPAMDAAINDPTNGPGSILGTLPSNNGNPPGTAALAQWATNKYVQTRPTGNAATLLMATLTNTTGGNISGLTVTYTLATNIVATREESPGHRVYYNLSGAAGGWVTLGNYGTVGAQSITLNLSATPWAANSLMYLLFVDDNSVTNNDGAYRIDNFQALPAATLSVGISTPADHAQFASGSTVTVTATNGGIAPTAVGFYTNGVHWQDATVAPFTVAQALADGVYSLQAFATNGVDPVASSAVITIIVRQPVTDYASGAYTNDFDIMQPAGTFTPQGWYVGAALPANTVGVTVGDGSAGAAAAIHGWNYGTTSDSDRALGTAPTGADRNIVLRLRNTGVSNIVSFQILYDGETWRNYTNAADGWLTNYVSYDQGATWIATGFNFDQPAALRVQPQTAINGNDPANRQAGIGGIVTPPTPVPPLGVIYIRWHDFNGSGTDGGLAVDNFSFEAIDFSPVVVDINLTAPTADQQINSVCGLANVTASATTGNPLVTNVTFTLDGTVILQDTTSPYSVSFAGVAAGAHTMMATAKDTLGNVTNTAIVNFSVLANQAPAVAIADTYNTGVTGLVWLVGTCISNRVATSDLDGTVTNLAFLVNGAVLETVANPAANRIILVNDALAGTFTFEAVATDNCGLSVTSAPVVVVVTNPPYNLILTNGASWKYAAGTNDLGTNGVPWAEVGFDDSGWTNAAAGMFGNDTSPAFTYRTPIDIGNPRYRTIYFRRTVDVPNASQYTNLLFNLMRDDGAVVYLNGTPVWTNNIASPNNGISYTNFASGANDNGTLYFRQAINPAGLLVSGLNTIAVEVHQSSATSSDLNFDLMIWGESSGAVPDLVVVRVDEDTIRLSWPNTGSYRVFTSTDAGVSRASWTEWTTTTPTLNGGTWELDIDVAPGEPARFFDLRP